MILKKSNLIVILFLLITLISLDPWSKTIHLFSYKIILARTFIIFIVFIGLLISLKYPFKLSSRWPVTLFLGWIIITTIRSLFFISGKEELTFFLLVVPGMLSVISIYYLDKLSLFRKLNKYWFKYTPFLFLLIVPFVKIESIGFFFPLLIIYLLFFKILHKKTKWFLLLFTFIILTISFETGVRSNVLKFGFAFILGMTIYLFSNKVLIKGVKFFRLFFLFAPIIFFFLGISNSFNVFKMDEYITSDYKFKSLDFEGNQIESSITEDSRTLVYSEVLSSAFRNNYIIFGRTFSRGYDSYFQVRRLEKTGKTFKYETTDRISEVSILNIFTWMGLVGVILYFILFFKATGLAIYHSNNVYIKIVGLFVGFRWMYAWVEDFQRFDISTISLWMLLALCFSPYFRLMNNKQITIYIKSILD